jgi:hypothetical protein
MKKILAISSALIVSGSAMAAGLNGSYTSTGIREAAQDISYPVSTERTGVVVPFNVTGITSVDDLGSAFNTVVNFDAAAALGLPSGTPVTMTGIGWDATIEALGQSWQSEMRVYFDDAIAPDGTGLHLRIGSANAPGIGSYNSGGITKLVDVAIPDLVLPNGILRMEFYESYDDDGGLGGVDGIWQSGFLNLQLVPEPASLSLLSLAALALLRRR